MRIAVVVLVGCATKAAPPPPVEKPVVDEGARRAALSAAQNERLDEQATALAAVCESKDVAPRCAPSCYVPEPADPRAGKRPMGAVEIQHRVCTRIDGVFVLLDEGANLQVRPAGRFPPAHPKGSWQAAVEASTRVALEPDLARGDIVRVTGDWQATTVAREALRCAPVSHFARALRRPLDACGSLGSTVCEASHSDAVHGINVIHYRLLEARRLHAEGNERGCLQAALEASAVARGMPRWRQYMSLNTTKWRPAKRYRTRFDGTLDEDALFATAIALGTEADAVYEACGGGRPKTSAKHEQSFHTCW